MKPHFICVGVQKGGTTSLNKYLRNHPDIFMPKNEKHLFDKPLEEGELTNKEIKQYENSFKTDKLIVGEKSPSYCYLKFAIDRIYKYDKNMKIIILFREPISRAFSHYNMTLNVEGKTLDDVTEKKILKHFKEKEHLKLNDLEKRDRRNFIMRGYYDEILEHILSKFPRENVYIGISEEIKNNKLKYYNEIFEFLGAKKLEKINYLDRHIRTYTKPIPKSLELYLYNIYKPHVEKFYKILGRKIDVWENYYNKLKLES